MQLAWCGTCIAGSEPWFDTQDHINQVVTVNPSLRRKRQEDQVLGRDQKGGDELMLFQGITLAINKLSSTPQKYLTRERQTL